MREEYSVKVTSVSKDDLTAKEKVMLKDTADAKLINDLTEGTIIYPDFWAELDVHNEQADDTDYKKYIIVDKDGVKYVTGSQSFWNSFRDIVADMQDSNESYGIKILKKNSKNRQGQMFLTCSIC